ncbi:MAG: response regulator transcription factor [Lachnospiraceae bacterium]|nr:response regulator transcription factor [Lachnospiraceae bacterium]
MKILMIEDDEGLNRGVSFALEQEGYAVVSARTLQDGKALFEKENPDAVILDLNLPDGDGLSFCKEIRQLPGDKAGTAVLMLTARDMETDEIMGLASGADDYMTKPFSVAVLKMRLQNILRRKEAGSDSNSAALADSGEDTVTSGDVVLDRKTFRAFNSGQELDLSMTEFRLLQYFLENKNQALLKEQILQRVWDTDGNFVEENTLSVNISRLRKKLGGNYIRTIQGIGYLWDEGQVNGVEEK